MNLVFPSQVQEYQGSSTLLRTTTYCYNGNQTSCSTAYAPNFPLTQRDTYVLLAGMSGSSRTTSFFDTYGNVTESDVYDFGASSPAFKAKTTYGSWSGSACAAIGSDIFDKPCEIIKYDVNSNAIADTKNVYDTKGNLTSTSKWVSGSFGTGTYLTTTISPNSNGTVAYTVDPNGNKTSFTYGSCNGGAPTTITPPISALATSQTWDSGCEEGQVVTKTDANSNSKSFAYSDPLSRMSSSTDELSNTTNVSYTPTTTESILNFGSSSIDNYVQNNPTALTVYKQSIEGPGGSWDSTETTAYQDTYGVTTTATAPCVQASKGSGCPSSTISKATHDALGRPLVATDAGGGTVTNSYIGSSNRFDTLTVVGPAPAGEVVKQVQKEYNGLGQLLSSCQISSGTGSVSCGQVNGGTGYLTSYSYNTDGTLASVTKGVQTHSSTYDRAGRVLSTTTPERGTTYAYYDSAPSTPGCSLHNGYQR